MPLAPVGLDKCFLCGTSLTAADVNSAEHVLPKWLQHRFNLWNEELVLTNRTSIPYRQATIPCCTACNNGSLGNLESEISAAFSAGPAAVRAVPEIRLFQWCCKMFYGLFYREHFLAADRRNPTAGPIIPQDLLHGIGMLWHFLQSVRKPFVFDGFVPWSIFVVETIAYGNPAADFDYYDSLLVSGRRGTRHTLGFAIRASNVGVICVLADNGAQKEHLHDEVDKFDFPMHPAQFIQLTSLVFIKASVLTYVPHYRWNDIDGKTVMQWVDPDVTFHWDDWDMPAFEAMYGEFLTRAGITPETVQTPDGRLPEFLFDAQHQPRRMDPDGNFVA